MECCYTMASSLARVRCISRFVFFFLMFIWGTLPRNSWIFVPFISLAYFLGLVSYFSRSTSNCRSMDDTSSYPPPLSASNSGFLKRVIWGHLWGEGGWLLDRVGASEWIFGSRWWDIVLRNCLLCHTMRSKTATKPTSPMTAQTRGTRIWTDSEIAWDKNWIKIHLIVITYIKCKWSYDERIGGKKHTASNFHPPCRKSI